jgi:glycosyltransferase involved in cell wall biosynthesis
MKAQGFEFIPWKLRQAVLSCIRAPRRHALFKHRKGIRQSDGLTLAFGGVLDDGRPVHGGAVKLLGLRDALPCNEESFSILYAVSSSQPECAEDLFGLCRQRGIKIVWNQNGVGYPAWAGRESERFNGPMRRLRAMADYVVYQSRFCEESALRFLGPSNQPSEILFNPVDTTRFAPAPNRIQSASLRLLCAGTHGTRDRVANALEALAVLRKSGLDADMTVAGSFQWKQGEKDFEEMVAALGLLKCVCRRPRFSQADAVAMYQDHDILIHPKYMDPCPTVVLEAMACGLPVVGSASGGMPELVDDSCGILVPGPIDWETLHTPSSHDLANAVIRVSENLESMSSAARRIAIERFSVPAWVEAHRKIFVSISE